jgi:hypothetical protein
MRRALICALHTFCATALLWAQSGVVDLPVNGARQITTTTEVTGLAPAYGGPSDPKAVVRLGPLTPGQRYEVTLTYYAGSDIGYAHAWVDGSPFGPDSQSFVGIGSGTGSRSLAGKQEKFLFTVDPASTSNMLHLVIRSTGKPLALKVSLAAPSGVTKQSQDRWGYFYVTDFDSDRTAPFKLTRGGPPVVVAPRAERPWIELPMNAERRTTTSASVTGLAPAYGAPSDPKAVFRLGPLTPGRRYEVTLTYDAGSDIGFAHAWVDGNPFGTDSQSFVGIGSGTGSRPLPDKQEKFLFTVDPASTSRFLFLVIRSTGKPFPLKVSLSAPTGVTRQSQDRWGYSHVTEFDTDRMAPFRLVR